MGNSKGARKGLSYVVTAVVVLLFAMLAAACGGGGDTSSDTGASTAAESGTEAGGDFAALEAAVAEAEQEPTEIAVKQPLSSKPEAGETIVFLECDVTQCQQQGAGLEQSAEAVGWKYDSIPFKTADPATLITGMKEALTKDPVAVVFSGTPEELWSQMIPAYEKAGVALIPLFIGPAKVEGPVIGNIGGPLDNEVAGRILADWFIVNSEGSGTALLQAVAGFPAVTLWQEDFEAEVAKKCPGCSVKTVEVTVAELAEGASTATTVSALQRDSSIGYVFAYNGNFIPGLSAELENAGLSEIQIGSYAATSDYVNEAVAGKDYAFLGLNTEYSGWLAADIAMRHTEGTELKPEETLLPIQLLTNKSATPELAEMANDFQLPADYKQEFKELWGAG